MRYWGYIPERILLACVVAVGIAACSTSDSGEDAITSTDHGADGQGADALAQDQAQEEVPVQPTGNATITAQVKLVKDFPLQVVALLKQYLTSPDHIFRGDLYLQVCESPECKAPVVKKVLEGELFSTGFAKEVTVTGLPAGERLLKFFLDTRYSQEYGGGYEATQVIGPMDVVQVANKTEVPTEGKNPLAGSVGVVLKDGETTPLGDVLLGHIVFDQPAFAPKTEDGYLLVAASGTDVFRNHIKVVDLEKLEVLDPVVLKLNGGDFEGDICGFVKGEGSSLYVVAVGAAGAYVFAFDTSTRQFASTEPVLIPHPDYKEGGPTAGLDPEKYPWPCRGTRIAKGNREFLYLVAFKGAGALQSSAPYPLVIVETTGMATGARGQVVARLDEDADPFFESSRIIRGAATDGEKLYLLEASWSKLVDKNTVYVFSVADGGTVTKVSQWESGTAEDTCGATNNWVPAIASVQWGGKTHILVGNDDDISVFDTQGQLVSKIDTTGYGLLITSFAVSPDGQTLYAMPNCKSSARKASVAAGVKGKRADLDRHAVVVVSLTSDPASPSLKHEDRDFDGDGTPDGGVDLEFLYLKENLLRWCESCTGVVPPTSYTGPEIAVGKSGLFMRGTGIQSAEKNSSGLGQVADIGLYDLESGKGVIFRNYQIWLDGPSSRWGFDLNPANAARDYTDDVSTSALLWVQK